MSIPIPNYTPVPNIIIDYWMPRLSSIEFNVLIFICRKTFGWHKVRDRISLSQIMEAVKSGRSRISEAIKKLIEHNIIKKITHGTEGSQQSFFEISFSNNCDQCQNGTPPSAETAPTKETPQKKEVKNKNTTTTYAKEKLKDFDTNSSNFLLSLHIPKAMLWNYIHTHSAAKITQAIKRAEKWKSAPSKEIAFFTALKAESWNDVDSVDELLAKNKEFLKSIYNLEGKIITGYKIAIGNDYFEASGGVSTLFNYSVNDKDFIDKVKKIIGK